MKLVLLIAAATLAACAAAPRDSAAERRERLFTAIALADPAFGGGEVLEQRLFAWPRYVASGDPLERQEFVRSVRVRADAEALALARELVAAPLLDAVGDFVESPAGAAAWAAETRALALFPWHHDGFLGEAASVFGDPEQCGQRAGERLRDLARELEAGDVSVSPAWSAILVAAISVLPEHARAIGAFHASAAGVQWAAARQAALARTGPQFEAAREEATRRGFVTCTVDLPDSALPRYLPAPEPALTFDLDAAGDVRCGERVLGNVAREAELLAALGALREPLLASGALHLVPIPEHGVDGVDEPVLIRVPKGTPWAHVHALLRLFSQRTVAFWKVELDCDPAIVPADYGRDG
jgi:hypothetical protein